MRGSRKGRQPAAAGGTAPEGTLIETSQPVPAWSTGYFLMERNELAMIVQAIEEGRSVAEPRVDCDDWRDNSWDEYRGLDSELKGDVAVISVRGPLMEVGEYYYGYAGYLSFARRFQQAQMDPRVREIVIYASTGGGTATGFTDAVDIIGLGKGTPNRKRVTAYVTQACSGGYALVMTADEIWINDIGRAGSIAAVFRHVNRQEANKRWGEEVTYVVTGEMKAWGNSDEPLSPEAKAMIEKDLMSIDTAFVTRAVQYRSAAGLTEEKIRALAGRVVVGAEAQAAGLADKVGSFQACLAAARARASTPVAGAAGAVTPPTILVGDVMDPRLLKLMGLTTAPDGAAGIEMLVKWAEERSAEISSLKSTLESNQSTIEKYKARIEDAASTIPPAEGAAAATTATPKCAVGDNCKITMGKAMDQTGTVDEVMANKTCYKVTLADGTVEYPCEDCIEKVVAAPPVDTQVAAQIKALQEELEQIKAAKAESDRKIEEARVEKEKATHAARIEAINAQLTIAGLPADGTAIQRKHLVAEVVERLVGDATIETVVAAVKAEAPTMFISTTTSREGSENGKEGQQRNGEDVEAAAEARRRPPAAPRIDTTSGQGLGRTGNGSEPAAAISTDEEARYRAELDQFKR